MALAAEHALDNGRHRLNRFFNGRNPERWVFTLNGTDALNMALKGVLNDGDHVITTDLEHNSVSRPLMAMAEAKRIALTALPPMAAEWSIPRPLPRLDAEDSACRGHACSAMCWAPCRTSPRREAGAYTRHPLPGRCRADGGGHPHRRASRVHRPVRVPRAQVAARPDRYRCARTPARGPTSGRGARAAPAATRPRPRSRRSSRITWRQARPTYWALRRVSRWAGFRRRSRGVDAIRHHELELCDRLRAALAELPGFEVFGHGDPATRRVGTVSFRCEIMPASDMGAILDQSFDIAVRPGLVIQRSLRPQGRRQLSRWSKWRQPRSIQHHGGH